jgi:hypothetical protein
MHRAASPLHVHVLSSQLKVFVRLDGTKDCEQIILNVKLEIRPPGGNLGTIQELAGGAGLTRKEGAALRRRLPQGDIVSRRATLDREELPKCSRLD